VIEAGPRRPTTKLEEVTNDETEGALLAAGSNPVRSGPQTDQGRSGTTIARVSVIIARQLIYSEVNAVSWEGWAVSDYCHQKKSGED